MQLYFTTKCDSKKEFLTKQNKRNYSNSLSLQFVLCIFTTHYTVDYYKHQLIPYRSTNTSSADSYRLFSLALSQLKVDDVFLAGTLST